MQYRVNRLRAAGKPCINGSQNYRCCQAAALYKSAGPSSDFGMLRAGAEQTKVVHVQHLLRMAMIAEVADRRAAGVLPEFADQVRLVGVAEALHQIEPGAARMMHPVARCGPEAQQAEPALGRQARLMGKLLLQPALRPAGLVCEPADVRPSGRGGHQIARGILQAVEARRVFPGEIADQVLLDQLAGSQAVRRPPEPLLQLAEHWVQTVEVQQINLIRHTFDAASQQVIGSRHLEDDHHEVHLPLKVGLGKDAVGSQQRRAVQHPAGIAAPIAAVQEAGVGRGFEGKHQHRHPAGADDVVLQVFEAGAGGSVADDIRAQRRCRADESNHGRSG